MQSGRISSTAFAYALARSLVTVFTCLLFFSHSFSVSPSLPSKIATGLCDSSSTIIVPYEKRFLNEKSSIPMTEPHSHCGYCSYRLINVRIMVSPLIFTFIDFKILAAPSQLVSIAKVTIKSTKRSVILL